MTARKKTKAGRKKAPARKKAAPRSPRPRRRRKAPEDGEPDRGGRPAIDWTEETADVVKELAEAGNTVADMAAILGVSKSALEKAIANHEVVAPAYRLGCAERRNQLRTAQYRTAKRGNATMQIWLGKQELGQRDVKAIEVGGPGGEPIPLEGDLGPIVRQKLGEFLRSRGKGEQPVRVPERKISKHKAEGEST